MDRKRLVTIGAGLVIGVAAVTVAGVFFDPNMALALVFLAFCLFAMFALNRSESRNLVMLQNFAHTLTLLKITSETGQKYSTVALEAIRILADHDVNRASDLSKRMSAITSEQAEAMSAWAKGEEETDEHDGE